MIGALFILAALQAAPVPNIVGSVAQPDRKIVVNRLPKGTDWLAHTPEARRMHAEASVQALKLNPFFGNCPALTPEAFEQAFGAEVAKSPDSPTITDAALAAYSICPTGGQ